MNVSTVHIEAEMGKIFLKNISYTKYSKNTKYTKKIKEISLYKNYSNSKYL